MLYGYARCSSADQSLDIQIDTLKAAGCQVVRAEKVSPRAQAILEQRREEALEGAEYVFPGRDGEAHQVVIKAFWKAACKRCGIEGVHIHDIRATYSTHLIASGESAKAVGKTMGHADAKTTMRYERIAQDRAKDIASKVDDLF